MDTDPTSAEDTANKSSDLTDLDTEDEEVLEEEGVTREEEEEEEEEGNEEEGNDEGNEEDEPVSNDDMEHSVIVVASGFRTSKRHPIEGITMMYRLVITFHGLRERTSQFTEVGYGLREWMVRSRKVGLRELTRYSAEEPPP